jgi:hypothetical protein
VILQSLKRINWNSLAIANIKKDEKLQNMRNWRKWIVDRVVECREIVQQQVGF